MSTAASWRKCRSPQRLWVAESKPSNLCLKTAECYARILESLIGFILWAKLYDAFYIAKQVKAQEKYLFFDWHVSSFFLPFFVSWFVFARFLLDGFFQQKQDKYQYCFLDRAPSWAFHNGNFIGPSLVQNKLQGIPPWMIMNFSWKICGPKIATRKLWDKIQLESINFRDFM